MLKLQDTVFVVCLVIFGACLIQEVQGQFEDVRCKCVCPADPASNQTVNATITNVLPAKCTCEFVMHKNESECLRCECKYESRNTLTIQVVVIFIILVIAVLLVYLVALLVLDPTMLRGESQMQQLQEEDIGPPDLQRQQSYIDRVGSAQQRWKRRVRQQRTNIFDRHTMLS
ncbi:proton-transporting V-type ATPase complex assembly regulator TMEM9-like [Amphiura filiformis]|uniref:proton-transporting V-type ATPase complex assembly regulator TMEM9-like n=1 Tax=Amphiura filiformis TaxID=82378 RepID=UPI003B21A476